MAVQAAAKISHLLKHKWNTSKAAIIISGWCRHICNWAADAGTDRVALKCNPSFNKVLMHHTCLLYESAKGT